MVTWADDFLKTAASLNDAATNFIHAYWQLAHSEYSSGNEDGLNLAVKSHYFGMQRAQWELNKYEDSAPVSGPSLEKVTVALITEAEFWAKNRGGDVQSFRKAQASFNLEARKVHAELLGIHL